MPTIDSDSRLRALQQAAASAAEKVLSDDIIRVMGADDTTKQHIEQRILEIFTQTLRNDQEAEIAALSSKLEATKRLSETAPNSFSIGGSFGVSAFESDRSREEVAIMSSRMHDLEDALRRITGERERERAANRQTLTNYRNDLARAETWRDQAAAARRRVAELTARMQTEERARRTAEEERDAALESAAQAKKSLRSIEAPVASMEEKQRSWKAERAQLVDVVAKYRAECKKREAAVRDLEGRIGRLTKDLDARTEDANRAVGAQSSTVARLRAVEEELSSARLEAREATEETFRVKRELSDTERAVDRYKKMITTAKRKFESEVAKERDAATVAAEQRAAASVADAEARVAAMSDELKRMRCSEEEKLAGLVEAAVRRTTEAAATTVQGVDKMLVDRLGALNDERLTASEHNRVLESKLQALEARCYAESQELVARKVAETKTRLDTEHHAIVGALRSELEAARTDCKAAADRAEQAESRARSADAAAMAARAAADDERAEAKNANDLAASEKRRAATLAVELDGVRATNERTARELRATQDELATACADLRAVRADLDVAQGAGSQHVAALEMKVHALEVEITRAETQVKNQKEASEALQARLATRDEEIAALRESHRESTASAQSTIADLRSERDAAVRSSEAAVKRAEAAEASCETLRGRIEEVLAANDELRTSAHLANGARSELQKAAEAAETERRAALEAQHAAEQKAATAAVVADTLRAQLASAHDEATEAAQRAKHAQMEMTAAQELASEADKARRSAEDSRRRAEEAVRELEVASAAFSERATAAESNAEAAEGGVRALREEAEELRTALAKANGEASRAQSACADAQKQAADASELTKTAKERVEKLRSTARSAVSTSVELSGKLSRAVQSLRVETATLAEVARVEATETGAVVAAALRSLQHKYQLHMQSTTASNADALSTADLALANAKSEIAILEGKVEDAERRVSGAVSTAKELVADAQRAAVRPYVDELKVVRDELANLKEMHTRHILDRNAEAQLQVETLLGESMM